MYKTVQAHNAQLTGYAETLQDGKLPFGKPTQKRIPRKRITVKESEHDIQGRAEDLCDALGVRFFRIPDKLLGFLRGAAPTWTRVFVARYFAGVPDMMLFKPLPDGRNEVCFLEIKTEAGKLSLSQSKWHSGLNVRVAYGWDEVERVIKEFSVEVKPYTGLNLLNEFCRFAEKEGYIDADWYAEEPKLIDRFLKHVQGISG